jgi:hypothetical protein
VRVSKCCENLIASLIQVDPSKRMSFSDFKKHPFIANDPEQYKALINEIVQKSTTTADQKDDENVNTS